MRIPKYFALILLLLVSSVSAGESTIEVRDIRYWSSPEYTRIVIDAAGPIEFSGNRLSNPDRLYFDLRNASINKEIKRNLPVGDGILKAVRAGQFNGTTVRIVFDIEEISDYKTFVLDDPTRLVVDLYGKTAKTEKPDVSSARRRIVIDAGHGGHDPGAVGPGNLYEKDVVLDIVLKVRDILVSDPMNEVCLTRDKDLYIPLEERTAIANRKEADLFVSVHANASPRRQTRGIETYLLNWTDDEEANKVAARENKISLKKMKAMNKQMDSVEAILSGLMRETKRDESIKLANYIQRSMISRLGKQYDNIPDLGVKQALFYVLFGAKMPSVLVEVSFISNPEEETRLSSDAYRWEIARSIAAGLNTYIGSTSVMQRMAALSGVPR